MKNSSTRLIRLLVVVALFAVMLFHAVPRAGAAPLLVDDFNVITNALVLSVTMANSPQNGLTDDPGTSSILGGERDVQGIVTAGDGTMTINASDSSLFSHSQPVGLRGQSIITWDGNDGNAAVLNGNGLGINLTATGNDTFILGSVSNDLATQVEVRVYSGAANWSSQTVSIPAGSLELAVPFFFSGFSLGGGTGADFTNVGAIQLIINSAATPTTALDMVIDFFTVTSSTAYQDFGDAPNTYSTVSSSNGPFHVMGNLVLGSLSDGEADGNPTALANGDDNTNLDDEDGVVRTGLPWANGANGGQVQVTVTGATSACLSGWMDFLPDGNFTPSTDDQIF
jgi:hypothetical protein